MSKDSSSFDPRFDAAFQRGFDGPVKASAPDGASAPGAAEAPFEVGLVEQEAADPSPRRANPFFLALGGIAVALIAGGLYLVSRMQAIFGDTSGASDFDFVTLQVLMYAAPLLVVLGIATAIGLLFIAAVRWGR